jgi:RimJ/RimL family protein N-acetyltransferase
VTLAGMHVRLEPLSRAHADQLCAACSDDEDWRDMPGRRPASEDEMQAWIDEALAAQAQGAQLPFAVVSVDDGRAVGSARYVATAPENGRLDVGWTWFERGHQGSLSSMECRFLMLQHAFETLGMSSVELPGESRNERSGKVTPGGSMRYTISKGEWPGVKAELLRRLTR